MVVIQIVTPLSKLDYGRGHPTPHSLLPREGGQLFFPSPPPQRTLFRCRARRRLPTGGGVMSGKSIKTLADQLWKNHGVSLLPPP